MSISQLSKLLPLPESELKQILEHETTQSKAEAAANFRNLLGESPEVVEFIASFNARRKEPEAPSAAHSGPSSSGIAPVPKPTRQPRKPKAQIHTPAPRQVTNLGPAPGTAYNKNMGNDYIPRRGSPAATASGSGTPARSSPVQKAAATPPPPQSQPKLPPSAAGHLISDVRSKSSNNKPKSNPVSRSSTPAPAPSKTKVQLSGGTAMHGASTALTDLDDAIRTLEATTNPALAPDDASRRCNCVAARHPLLAAAPNCLRCGKVVCVKEGLGPCTFCGAPLLSPGEVQSMIRELRAERGREKQAADKQAHRRADVSKTPAPFSRPRDGAAADGEGGDDEAARKALEHRDRLLGFQAQNARRTTVRDEAADFDVSGAVAGYGSNIWATPEERARELKRQQKVLREMEWNARPEYEKRRQVVSIDLVGGKVVRKMAAIERPPTPEDEDEGQQQQQQSSPALKETSGNRRGGGTSGAFSKNPLLGSLIKPIFDAKGKGAQLEGRKPGATKWRRVQDDLDNNEAVILDGGAYGGGKADQEISSSVDEPACG
ncbi:zf-C2HC5-domain-containing protein [Hypoxylon rubiginosum]|uniref:Zf-C2HC5-domain-containing protein n=1 Tax=Hypoxylon rubiginosum TaxID=110542 RepID=A0ACC0D4P4_9PEZI|nr:zf-C2HC5-domain-containing protein [Hypoxylon rubiginosum]